MKSRMETSAEGTTSVFLADYGTEIAYMWLVEENIAYKVDWSQAPSNPTEDGEQIHPTYLGTATVDGHLCDVYQWTDQGTTEKMWIWKEKSFPVKMEVTTSSGTMTTEYKNIVFGTLSNDLFQLPADVQIMQFP
jgi:outer membrane lipoprotein-sorting protein